jgi:membrane-associated phospholipid phosphatase
MGPSPNLLLVARIISTLGHPLLLLAVSSAVIAFRSYDSARASVVSSVIIGVVIIPVTIHNVWKTKTKAYTNFDVSDQQQRKSFYKVGLLLLAIATAVLFFIPDATGFFIGTLFAFLMMLTSALVNLKIKSSLHTSVCMYLIFVYGLFNITLALVMFGFTIIVAGSRLVLKRHTETEVMVGALIGVCFGMMLVWWERIQGLINYR